MTSTGRRVAALSWAAWLAVAGVGAAPPEDYAAGCARISASRGATNDAVRLRQLFDLHWRQAMAEFPEAATANGYPGQNARWTDLSRTAIERRKSELQRPLGVLETIDHAALTGDDALHADLFRRALRLDLEGLRFPGELLLITPLDGLQVEMARTLDLQPRSRPEEIADVVARLEGADIFIRQTQELLREGAARGVTPPRIALRDVPQQVLNLIPDDPRRSPFFRSLAEPSAPMTEGELRPLQSAGLAAITNRVYPAVRELHRFLVAEYLPACRTNIACAALPDGRAWYAYLARRHTTTDLTPEQIHELGQAEVRRIRAEMDRVIAQTGYTGSFAEFLKFLRTDPRFYYQRGTELLAGYRDISKRIDGGLPRLFGRLPRTPYGVLAVPGYSERSQTTAYYQPGALAAGRPGVFYANTYDLTMRPQWEMEALTLHEAVPGHHLQIALAQELEEVPEFQKHAGVTAFVEGWALYAEGLGPELGLYQDPYSKFGQLTYEMWRAIRLVVDTGMHSLGWSRDQALDFFRENAAKTEHDIVVEVDRYIAWPGQALAYKIGQLRIQALRVRAAETLGARFDVRAFHDELLAHGALPLDILETRMNAWIEHQASP